MAKNNYRSMSPEARERAKAYQRKPEQIRNRSRRNKARAEKEKELGRELGENEHVHHVGGINGNGKTEVVSAKQNLGNKDPDKDGGLGSRQKGSKRKGAVLSRLRT